MHALRHGSIPVHPRLQTGVIRRMAVHVSELLLGCGHQKWGWLRPLTSEAPARAHAGINHSCMAKMTGLEQPRQKMGTPCPNS